MFREITRIGRDSYSEFSKVLSIVTRKVQKFAISFMGKIEFSNNKLNSIINKKNYALTVGPPR